MSDEDREVFRQQQKAEEERRWKERRRAGQRLDLIVELSKALLTGLASSGRLPSPGDTAQAIQRAGVAADALLKLAPDPDDL